MASAISSTKRVCRPALVLMDVDFDMNVYARLCSEVDATRLAFLRSNRALRGLPVSNVAFYEAEVFIGFELI